MFSYSVLKDSFLTIKGIVMYHSFLKNSCYWPKERIQIYQFEKLKELLCKTYRDVPYYTNLFDKINFQPLRDFNNLGDLSKIPILSKNVFKENKELFLNKRHVKGSILFKTSGSTGTPMDILVHQNQWIMEQGVIWRHWKWGGYNFRDPLAMVRSYVPTSDEILWKTDNISNFTYFSPFHLNDENMSRYLNVMIMKNIIVLRGYPSSIATLAEFILRSNHDIPKIKLVLTASEVLSDKDRKLIEAAFKAKISNHYGLAEQIVMMGDCEKHEGLHNYDEYGYLELLDTDVPNIKRIIGTNLHNLTTPLIRYDTGDLAVVSDERCSCGRSSGIIKNIIGRKDLTIKTIEGYEIPTTNFYTLLEHYNEIDRWQIVQKSLNEIEVIFASKSITPERIVSLEHDFKRRLSDKMLIEFSPNKNFHQKNEGKVNPFISLL